MLKLYQFLPIANLRIINAFFNIFMTYSLFKRKKRCLLIFEDQIQLFSSSY